MKLKIFTLFAGYGTDHFALKRLGIDYENVGFSEIDKWAILCFKNNHGGDNYGNVREINPNDLPDFDLLTGGFPCTTFSSAGNMMGELDPRGTLFYEIIRIAEVKQPKYILLENVKGLTFKKFKGTFDKILSELDRIGYKVYWKVLNSKDYGTPQNRERVWFVCIRKDINQEFSFPKKQELNIFIKDLLLDEVEVDKKYILNESQIKTLMRRFGAKGKLLDLDKDNEIPTLTTVMGSGGGNIPCITNVAPREVGFKERCPSLCARDYKEPKVVLYDAKTLGSNEEVCHTIRSGSGSGNNIYVENKKVFVFDCYNHKIKEDGVSITLTNPNHNTLRIGIESNIYASKSGSGSGNNIYMEKNTILRKLTPVECFRFMGFFNDEINLEGLSDTQIYKLAGNGQDVNVVYLILKNLIPMKYLMSD